MLTLARCSGSLVLCCGLMAAAMPVQASDQVYRCGQSYQTEPCPGGKAVAVGDARDDAARREAQRVAQREAQAAQQLQAERLQRERLVPHSATQPAVVRHRAAEAAAQAPAEDASQLPLCTRKSGLRTQGVGGCRDEMVYTAPGTGRKPKAEPNTRRRQTL
ncbi:hypothetical protein [Ideonella paludis]|uniref:DUF4124 domain-containing protein n=1 Tax=Ideonella paludis TaxID=1233411 RepID=A0ABS5E2B5_9BURK|nr:hypothetical protein [Ideonella paludis]MBQ0937533.1 hypothetical protein [Ideonella paludis]